MISLTNCRNTFVVKLGYFVKFWIAAGSKIPQKMWSQCLLCIIEICFLIFMHKETSKSKQSVLALFSPVSSIKTKTLCISPRWWSYVRICNQLNTCYSIRCAYLLTWCAHANNVKKSCFYIIDQIEVADEFIISKNPDLTRVFIIQPRHPGRLKNRSGWKNSAVGALHMRTNACQRNLKWMFENLLLFYCYAIKTNTRTIRGHPNCLWNVGCQIVAVLMFLTGASAKLKRRHVKSYAVALSV